MAKYLTTVTETYRVDTENEVEELISYEVLEDAALEEEVVEETKEEIVGE